MKHFISFLGMLMLCVLPSMAHNDASPRRSKKRATSPYPIETYAEPRVGTAPNLNEWNALADGLHASWASRDELYSLHRVPQLAETSEATVHGWKGERVNLTAVLFSKRDEGTLTLRLTPWVKDGVQTAVKAGSARFMNYVITDDYKACGNHDMSLQPWLVPDVIDGTTRTVPAMETRPVWCSLEIPRDIEAGTYTTTVEVLSDKQVLKTLRLTIHVNSRSLPTVANQKFHLDLWQQPYAVSRYYGVERWSKEHIQALRPYLQALGAAGQRVVSTIMFYEPWGEQTHDKFSPMIESTKKANGTWTYNYDVFDRYVNLCAEYGIDKQINCYSMVPWDMTFRYYDEARQDTVDLKTTTDSPEYKDLWNNFLRSFKQHLQDKGWFEKTYIAMDERGEQAMLNAHAIASAHGFKMALAGNYHSSLNNKLADFCVALNQVQRFTPAERAYRKNNHLITTIYTSCADAEPNIYTNSLPAEAAYLPLHAAANDLDGYLHWSWINWDEHPLTDSRFRKFGSGDTYCYYPGNRSSVRFERLVEGIHQFEKIQILREEYRDDPEKLRTLNTLVAACQPYAVAGVDCASKVNTLEAFLNGVITELPQTTYYTMVCKDGANHPYLYHNALLAGNANRLTLQSPSKVKGNTGVWRVASDDQKTFYLQNGDGMGITPGHVSGTHAPVGPYTSLNVKYTLTENNIQWYEFKEDINRSNGSAAYKVGDTRHITVWNPGTGNHPASNLWQFEPIDLTDKYVYDVHITAPEGVESTSLYVNLRSDASSYAFDGGFFLTPTPLTSSEVKVASTAGRVLRAEVQVSDGRIQVNHVEMAPVTVRQDLFNTSKGGKGIPPYRIPGITVAHNGRLIATAARLVCGTDPGFGQVDVVVRTSDNQGKDWSAIKDVAVGTGITSATQNFFDTAFGDPAVVADRTSSEVLVLAVAGCTHYGSPYTTRQNPNMIAAIHSLDNGDTWQQPVDVTEQIYSLYDAGKVMQAGFVGGGKVFQSRQVKVGKYYRLYAALCARPNGNRVIYSDDFGRTWHALGGASALPAPEGNEPKCEELPDGRVILSSRVGGGGRIYNLYTYTDTRKGEGKWSASFRSTYEGSGQNPGTNDTNGEMLILPVKRNADQQDMYLALQSQPASNSRTNVGIYYKELSELDDLRSVRHLSTGWDGFYQVSAKSSAYSSMDLQQDDKIGFIFEETLTFWEKVPNPVTTSFPTGAGTHNYDGFDNIYLPLDLEEITDGRYSVNRSVNRGAFVRAYLTQLVGKSSLSASNKGEVTTLINALPDEPTPEALDRIYTLLDVPFTPSTEAVYTFLCKRGSRYVTSNGMGKNLTGNTRLNEDGTAYWVFRTRADGKFDLVNYKDGSLIKGDGVASGSPMTTQSAAATGWEVKPSDSEGWMILVGGKHQFNQQNHSNYYILNWGDGSNRSDEGCQYLIEPVEGLLAINAPYLATTAVSAPTSPLEDETVSILSVGGMQLPHLQRGLNIVRTRSGRVHKVVH